MDQWTQCLVSYYFTVVRSPFMKLNLVHFEDLAVFNSKSNQNKWEMKPWKKACVANSIYLASTFYQLSTFTLLYNKPNCIYLAKKTLRSVFLEKKSFHFKEPSTNILDKTTKDERYIDYLKKPNKRNNWLTPLCLKLHFQVFSDQAEYPLIHWLFHDLTRITMKHGSIFSFTRLSSYWWYQWRNFPLGTFMWVN